jgi:ABC-type branched-subunit amino acid transport system ATPase component
MVTPAEAGAPALQVRGIRKSFGGIHVLKGIDLEIARGTIVGLIGPNGCGKSTLFDIITGYQKADEGEVLFNGEPIGRRPPHVISQRGLIRTFQLTRVFKNLTVAENLLVFAPHDSGAAGRERVAELLDFVHLAHLASSEASALSYGQLKLLEIAQVLMLEPEMMLLDEPMAGINPGLIEEIVQLLMTLRDRGITILLVEHNLPIVARLCDRIAVVSAGVVELEGVPADIVSNQRVKEVFLGDQ